MYLFSWHLLEIPSRKNMLIFQIFQFHRQMDVETDLDMDTDTDTDTNIDNYWIL